LTKPKNALTKQYQKLFEMEGVHLTFSEDALKAISKKAILRKTGARGLRAILETILLDLMFTLPELENVAEIVINGDTVDNGKPPLQIAPDKKKPAKVTGA
jgi:ATP-dependent Clp protease ATP-binding subunit ClpX